MKTNNPLPACEITQGIDLLCHKYYGGVLAQDVMRGLSDVSHPCTPEDYALSTGGRPFTPTEYLCYLGKLGYDTDGIEAWVGAIEKSLQDDIDKAEAFFKLFQNEWHVAQSDVEKYINDSSIYHFIELVVADAASTKARLKAVKRHAENHSMKKEVFIWLDTNMSKYKSMDSAAEAIAGKVTPIKFRTARDWVGEWKKLRSASKP